MPTATRIAIINRSFWPASQVIGEALLQVAERLAENHQVSLITQSPIDLKAELKQQRRGQGVVVRVCKARSDSSTHLVLRALDALVFMMWVFAMLCWQRPKKIYVSTDPPVVVPFVVSVYALFGRANVIYHLQDIHPEAANIIVPLHPFVMRLFQGIDSWSMRRAMRLITLSADMANVIRERSRSNAPIQLLDNPAVIAPVKSVERTRGFIYCGNAGRLQRVPLLIEAISAYRRQGGVLPFEFVGGGVFSAQLAELAVKEVGVSYLGHVSAAKAAERVAAYQWAILSIDDEVTRFAFPSKSSTYAAAGASVLAVCGQHTSVAKWVLGLGIGRACEPNVAALVSELFAIEQLVDAPSKVCPDLSRLDMSYFVNELSLTICA